MYICKDCGKEYKSEELMRRHMVKCWKEHNPNHKSKDAPRSEDVNERIVNNDILSFFNSLKG